MRISFEWAMTREDSGYAPCGWCEAEFEPSPVIVRLQSDVDQICGEGAEAILRRSEKG